MWTRNGRLPNGVSTTLTMARADVFRIRVRWRNGRQVLQGQTATSPLGPVAYSRHARDPPVGRMREMIGTRGEGAGTTIRGLDPQRAEFSRRN